MEVILFLKSLTSNIISDLDTDICIDNFLTNEEEWSNLIKSIQLGYDENNSSLLYSSHLLLNTIYKKITKVPDLQSSTYEASYKLYRIRLLLEELFISDLRKSVKDMVPNDLDSISKFSDWMKDFVDSHPVAEHSAYFDYLSNKATKSDIRFYLLQESTIDANTDDFLASLLIGSNDQAKLEIAANLWDEMGEGDINLLHSKLFNLALDQFEIREEEVNDSLTLESLFCGNLQTMLSIRREFFYHGVGYFAATEQLVSDRFIALKNGWERLELPDAGATYHLLHIEVDCHHTVRWYNEVIEPLSTKFEGSREKMVEGALFRLYTSEKYLDMLNESFDRLYA